MAKHGKRGIPHERRSQKTDTGAVIYTERRGLRGIIIEAGQQPTTTEKASALDSENPSDKARFLNLAANRLLTRAGEATLQVVIQGAMASKANDQDAAISSASIKWLAALMKKYGVLSPIAVAAQFLFHQSAIINRLSWYAEGAENNSISDEAADKSVKDITELFSAVYALCDSWHWLRMELHGDHARLIEARDVAESRKKGAAANSNKKERRQTIIGDEFQKYIDVGGDLSLGAKEIAESIKPAAKRQCAAQSLGFISDDQLIRMVRNLKSRKSQ